MKIRSKLYMETRLHYANHKLQFEKDPDGYLFSRGRYPTKIKASDLPEHFVYGYLYKRHGYISAQGVKHLKYVPDYTVTNHLFKYDSLFISYDSEIVPAEANDSLLCSGYDYVISGPIIEDFVRAVGLHSDYDIASVLEGIESKKAWFRENNDEEMNQKNDIGNC